MAQWRALWELLEGDFKLLAPDLLGYGGTAEWVGNPGELLRDEAALVSALADHAGGKFHLVGHSFGGAVVLRLAMEQPGRLLSLTLIEPMACWLLDPHDPADHYAEIKGVADTYRECFEAGDKEGAVKPYIEYWNGAGTWESLSEDFQNYVLRTAEKTLNEFTAIFDPANQIGDLEKLDIPTLVMRGGETHPPTRRMTEIILDAMPRAQGAVIDGAGHMSPLTHTEQVNGEIERHLKSF